MIPQNALHATILLLVAEARTERIVKFDHQSFLSACITQVHVSIPNWGADYPYCTAPRLFSGQPRNQQEDSLEIRYGIFKIGVRGGAVG